MSNSDDCPDFDAIVIGTGFGGAVTACRLVEAGYRICVLERGRRYGPDDFPRYPTEDLFRTEGETVQHVTPMPDFSKWLWERDHGLFDVRDLGDAVAVQAAGYGGGSLIYANVHLRPPVSVFTEDWPDAYRNNQLDPYFDLAACMLRVAPIPQRLAKTVQLERGAEAVVKNDSRLWFRLPLAINFLQQGDNEDKPTKNPFGRDQHTCDMRGRCCVGCDRQAKNTLDLNYLALAENGTPTPDIRTLAEVTRICPPRKNKGERFKVYYNDLLSRGRRTAAKAVAPPRCVSATFVFLCAGSIATTELLLKMDREEPDEARCPEKDLGRLPAIGSRYFPNSDSLAAVFECDEPHEPDYGPTITSAMLCEANATGDFSRSVDFALAEVPPDTFSPRAGMIVTWGERSSATLAYDPALDFGSWKSGDAAVGTLVLTEFHGEEEITPGVNLTLHTPPSKEHKVDEGQERESRVVVEARSPLVAHRHWFLVEDGGFPPDMAPLAGIFRSPLWARRNRFREDRAAARVPAASVSERMAPRRTLIPHLRIEALTDALRGTSTRALQEDGLLGRAFNTPLTAQSPIGQAVPTLGPHGELLPRPTRGAGLDDRPVSTFLPTWFQDAISAGRTAVADEATAFALPLLGRLLDEISRNLADQLDTETLAQFRIPVHKGDPRTQLFIRGMLRQAVQFLAGSEAGIAKAIGRILLDPVPGTPSKLVDLLGDLLLWALAYRADDGHTGLLLTMGRDFYRGRLSLQDGQIAATLPGRLLDTSSVLQERVVRTIASAGWHGELRTNPAWATLSRRLTVHSQGGCPMGSDKRYRVTAPDGEVYEYPGLFVMDAAAFPTSVGVNPSATIAAVAEYKIEQFVENHDDVDKDFRRQREAWIEKRGDQKVDAVAWVNHIGRDIIDPLGSRPRQDIDPEFEVLRLTFKEEVQGFYGVPAKEVDMRNLCAASDQIRDFEEAEQSGIAQRKTIEMVLVAVIEDLARLVSMDGAAVSSRIRLKGEVTFHDRVPRPLDADASFVKMFVPPPKDVEPRMRFFVYHVVFAGDKNETCTLDGIKVLRNDPGRDVWQDTSTLYFVLKCGEAVRHGIAHLSFEKFLLSQLPSMTITGTTDATRQSWALAAFFKYFAEELTAIYMDRAASFLRLVQDATRSINV